MFSQKQNTHNIRDNIEINLIYYFIKKKKNNKSLWFAQKQKNAHKKIYCNPVLIVDHWRKNTVNLMVWDLIWIPLPNNLLTYFYLNGYMLWLFLLGKNPWAEAFKSETMIKCFVNNDHRMEIVWILWSIRWLSSYKEMGCINWGNLEYNLIKMHVGYNTALVHVYLLNVCVEYMYICTYYLTCWNWHPAGFEGTKWNRPST